MRTLLVLPLLFASLASAATHQVRNDQELRAALQKLQPGDTLRLAPGRYHGGLQRADLHGTAEKPIVIEGGPGPFPQIEGGQTGLHFANCSHLTLRRLHLSDQSHNGLNIDDGGDYDTPSHHLILEDLQVSRIGPRGNFDAIKLSGIDDFLVRNCTMTGWGGQAIDMVGCHRGVIESCTFQGLDGFSQQTGPQTKGGSEAIVIRHSTFLQAGGRPLQLGGSTGLAYFRPKGAKFEARNVVAHDNLIVGGQCAVAFAGLDGGEFHHNTIINPEKWVMRILQENNEPGFAPCREVEFHHNLVSFESSKVHLVANIGPNTQPATFTFHHNAWFAPDSPGHSKPDLPSNPTSSVVGEDPRIDPNSFYPTAAWARQYGRRPK